MINNLFNEVNSHFVMGLPRVIPTVRPSYLSLPHTLMMIVRTAGLPRMLLPGLQRVVPRPAALAAPAAALLHPRRGRVRGRHGDRVRHIHHAVPKRSVLLPPTGEYRW